MVNFSFKCDNCDKRFSFKPHEEIKNPKKHDKDKKFLKLCNNCFNEQKNKEKQREINYKTSKKEKEKQKKETEEKANKKLLEDLKKEEETEENKEKQKEIKKAEKEERKIQLETEKSDKKEKDNIIIKENLEKKAEELSNFYKRVLYIYADVKRVKALEWINSKKRIALNKEREIRKTHKGGWSQEKFQKFVVSKKKKSADWVSEQLTRKGVLRFPYEHIIIDTKDEELKSVIEKICNK